MRGIYTTILLICFIFNLILLFSIQEPKEIVQNDNDHHVYITSNCNYIEGACFIVEIKLFLKTVIKVSIVKNATVPIKKVYTTLINNICGYIPFYGEINNRKQLPRCNTFGETEHLFFDFRCF